MKKAISFLMALMLLCAMNVATADPTTATGEMTVSMTVNTEHIVPTYIVTIPAEVEIDVETLTGKAEIVLKRGWNLHAYNYLRVYLAGAQNGINDYRNGYNFNIKNENGTACKYDVKPNGSPCSFAVRVYSSTYSGVTHYDTYAYSTYALLDVYKTHDNTSDRKATLDFRAEKIPTDPGTYTDTLTFSIKITE